MLLIDLPSHPHPQKLKKVPNTVLRVDNKSGVFIRGLRIPPRFSPCETHSREMAKSLGFDPSLKVKTCFDCKMFDFANWVFRFNGEHGSRVTPSHEALSFSLQGPLRYPCWTTHPWSETISAHLEWCQNPANMFTSQTVSQSSISQQSSTSQPPRQVIERITDPQRSSTRTIYNSKWALFEIWCIENSVDFSTPSVKQVSDFSCTCTIRSKQVPLDH